MRLTDTLFGSKFRRQCFGRQFLGHERLRHQRFRLRGWRGQLKIGKIEVEHFQRG